jgi:uncharacterized protein YprB with RNaseH-like and TPR domain
LFAYALQTPKGPILHLRYAGSFTQEIEQLGLFLQDLRRNGNPTAFNGRTFDIRILHQRAFGHLTMLEDDYTYHELLDHVRKDPHIKSNEKTLRAYELSIMKFDRKGDIPNNRIGEVHRNHLLGEEDECAEIIREHGKLDIATEAHMTHRYLLKRS